MWTLLLRKDLLDQLYVLDNLWKVWAISAGDPGLPIVTELPGYPIHWMESESGRKEKIAVISDEV